MPPWSKATVFTACRASSSRKPSKRPKAEGNRHFSHFGPQANHFDKLAELFETYGKTGSGKKRYYIHSDAEAAHHNKRLNTKLNVGEFTPWEDVPAGSDLLFYEGLHGLAKTDDVDVSGAC